MSQVLKNKIQKHLESLRIRKKKVHYIYIVDFLFPRNGSPSSHSCDKIDCKVITPENSEKNFMKTGNVCESVKENKRIPEVVFVS